MRRCQDDEPRLALSDMAGRAALAQAEARSALCLEAIEEARKVRQTAREVRAMSRATREESSRIRAEVQESRRKGHVLVCGPPQAEPRNVQPDTFAPAVAHELRNRLSSIAMAAERLARECHKKDEQWPLRTTQSILAGTERMNRVVEALLGFARTDQRELALTQVDFSALARAVTESALRRLEGPAIDVRVQSELSVRADEDLLEIVLTNLIGNAIKYSEKRVDPCIEVGGAFRGNELVFYVRDNGVGFDMANADRLFAPFRRLHNTQDFPGLGIGLATVARIVAKHGGAIWPEAAVNRGSTFYFTLGEVGSALRVPVLLDPCQIGPRELGHSALSFT